MSSAAPANPAPIVRIGPASDRAALAVTMPRAVARLDRSLASVAQSLGHSGLWMAQVVVRRAKRQPSAGRRAYQGTTISSSSNPPRMLGTSFLCHRSKQTTCQTPRVRFARLPIVAVVGSERLIAMPKSSCRFCSTELSLRAYKKIRSGSPPPFWAAYTPESTFCSLTFFVAHTAPRP